MKLGKVILIGLVLVATIWAVFFMYREQQLQKLCFSIKVGDDYGDVYQTMLSYKGFNVVMTPKLKMSIVEGSKYSGTVIIKHENASFIDAPCAIIFKDGLVVEAYPLL